MNKPFIKPSHCGISIADMQESIDWYEKMLGFELVFRKSIDQSNCEIAFLKAGDFEVELFRHYDTIPLPPERRDLDKDIQIQGIKHLCYEVEDITAFFNDLRTKGADIAIEPMKIGDMLLGFIRDNTGNLIELAQKKL